MTKNSKKYEVLDCPSHNDNICILSRLKRIKGSSGVINSPKSDTDDGLSSCSNFHESPTPEELETDKLILPEIEH